MPILKREDGTQFAIHAYRELLQPAKASVLKNEIRMLAKNHGEYIRLFKLPSGQTEAVFSRDPGYLLGEAVWQYFSKPSDLIYCEALGGKSALVVVVRDGAVYLDTKIPYSSFADEFASIVTSPNKYDIYIYGDVPLSATKERGKLTVDQSQIKSFTILESSVFQNLTPDPALQLQPLEFALRAQRVGGFSPLTLFIVGLIVIIIIIGWWYQHRAKPIPVVKPAPTVTQAPPVDPYAGYQAALMTPAPEQQLAELATLVGLVYNIHGWNASGVTFNGSLYTIQLNSMGGTITLLNQWAKNHNMTMTLSAQGVTLVFHSNIRNREKSDIIYPVQQVVYTLIDRINRVLPERSVSLGNSIALPYYKSTNLSIQLNGVSPDVLVLIGKQLANLPVQLNSVQLNINDGLLSGTIQLTVLGN